MTKAQRRFPFTTQRRARCKDCNGDGLIATTITVNPRVYGRKVVQPAAKICPTCQGWGVVPADGTPSTSERQLGALL